ncbi:MAG: hypothetical protein ACFCGT_20085 [Sandaracinaceae bacterium]
MRRAATALVVLTALGPGSALAQGGGSGDDGRADAQEGAPPLAPGDDRTATSGTATNGTATSGTATSGAATAGTATTGDPEGSASGAGTAADPPGSIADEAGTTVPPLAAYLERVQNGIELLNLGDRYGAGLAFTDAEAMAPRRPEARYWRAVPHRLAGELEEAVATFRQAAEAAGTAHPRWAARALHGAASTLEATDGGLRGAREAWLRYITFAQETAGVDAAVGEQRLAAIEAFLLLDEESARVRARIAEREQARAGR